MRLKSVRPIGIFRARTVRDGEALRRDGEPFFMLNTLESSGEVTVEICFADSMWMIATPQDIQLADAALDTPES